MFRLIVNPQKSIQKLETYIIYHYLSRKALSCLLGSCYKERSQKNKLCAHRARTFLPSWSQLLKLLHI